MPKTKISEFSATPANNTDIDSINIAEGCAPSGINDAIRELMAQLKDFQTGAVGDSFNGPVGTSTAAAGAFTTLSASSTVSGTGFSTYLASPPAIGGTAAAAGAFTTLSASGAVTLSGGTANGVAYLNGSKVVTSGSALTFDGSNFFGGTNIYASGRFYAQRSSSSLNLPIAGYTDGSAGAVLSGTKGDIVAFGNAGGDGVIFANSNTEQMRLTSTGLGIGTTSIGERLVVSGSASVDVYKLRSNTSAPASTDAFIYRPADNTIGFGTGSAEKMRLDSSGNLGLGVTPSAWTSAGIKAFQIGGVALTQDDTIFRGRFFTNTGFASGNFVYLQNNHALQYLQRGDTGVHSWLTAPSGTAGNTITFTQAATLTAGGNFHIARTTTADTTVGASLFADGTITCARSASDNANLNLYVYSTGAGAARFYVGMGGTVYATSTTITAISDQRLKENIRDLDDGLDVVMALKPRKFDWKEGKGKDIKNDRGFIAQEFETVLPDMVENWADPAPEGEEAYKAVNANLIPTLVKAIQELKSEFDAYKAAHP